MLPRVYPPPLGKKASESATSRARLIRVLLQGVSSFSCQGLDSDWAEEFIRGCCRIRGEAKSMDLHSLRHSPLRRDNCLTPDGNSSNSSRAIYLLGVFLLDVAASEVTRCWVLVSDAELPGTKCRPCASTWNRPSRSLTGGKLQV